MPEKSPEQALEQAQNLARIYIDSQVHYELKVAAVQEQQSLRPFADTIIRLGLETWRKQKPIAS